MPRDDIYAQPVRTFLRSRVLWSWVRTLALATATLIGVSYAAYSIAIWAEPPFAEDGYHRVMPVGQALFAAVVGVMCSIGAIVIDRLVQRRRRLAVIASYMDPTPARALRR